MAAITPFALLEKIVNPMLANVDADARPSSDPLLSTAEFRIAEGVQVPESATIDIYAFTSEPAVLIGDLLAYQSSPAHIKQGQIKAKKFTQQIQISEDYMHRMMANQGNATNICGDMVGDQKKKNNQFFIQQLRSVLFKGLPYLLSGGSAEGDSKVIAVLGAGTGGTLSNPYDLNATAGTQLSLTSTVSLYGGQQTYNNVARIMSNVLAGMVKIDVDTGMVLPIGKLYMACNPLTYGVLAGTYDILNSTGAISIKPYLKLLEENHGVTVFQEYYADSTVTSAEDDTSILTFWGEDTIRFYMIPGAQGIEAWSPWNMVPVVNGEKMQFFYETHKAFEMAFYAIPYFIRPTSGADGYFYKKVFRVEVTQYNNAS